MGLYEMIDPEEGGKEFGHLMYEELSPTSANMKG